MTLMVLTSSLLSLLSSLLLLRRFCDHSVHRTRIGFKFGCASSILWPRFGAPPGLLGFDSVLRTKPSASPRCSSLAPRCSPLVPRCSTLNLWPQCSSSVLSSGKFLFCSSICHPFLSCTLLTQLLPLYLIRLIATFLRFFLFQSSLIPCILSLLYSLLPFHSLSFHLNTTRYATE
jgi:hypothetical protein